MFVLIREHVFILKNMFEKKKKMKKEKGKKIIHMKNCEAMTTSTHSFAYSYRLFKKGFVENYEN